MAQPSAPLAQPQGSTEGKTSKRRVSTYKPQKRSLPDQLLPDPEYIVVRPYPGGGSGLTQALNYLLRERGNYDEFGGRGFFYLVKKYTETGHIMHEKEGESYAYSMPEIMTAWQEHGLVPEALWPGDLKGDETLTSEQAEAAHRYRPTSYQRVAKNVETVKTALVEHHAVIAGFAVHEGWQTGVHDGVIEFKPDKSKVIGGLGAVILGYTSQGFFIQNTWGPEWAGVTLGGKTYPGAAILTYPDFDANYGEGYVATLPDALFVRNLLRRAGYASDTLDGTDQLGITTDVEAVCSVLAARDVKPPLALGLFGNWGTGKSFFMARMHEEIEALSRLEREHPGETPYCGEIVQIPFNAWHYLDANLWASLVSEIFERLFQAVSDPVETPDQTRRRVARRLGEARGLYRQSRLELEQAKQERIQAQANLDEKSREVVSQRASLAELTDQLATLLAGDPQVQQRVEQLAQRMGVPEVARSYAALRDQVNQAATLGGRLRQILRVVFNRAGRRDRLILLAGLLAGPPLMGALLGYVATAMPTLIAEVHRVLNVTTGALLSLTALVAQLVRGGRIVDRLQKVVDQVEQVRQRRLDVLIQPQKAQLEANTKAESEAQERLDTAEQRVAALERELSGLSPEHQVQAFVGERTSSEDYKKQLGLVSLVRRDFEKLSELMQTSQALEARWYERRRAALAAGKPFNRPKHRLLPLQRVILYIDDLDRCQPDRVIEVLEAVHLLLAFPLFVVVVAVDPRWLRQCLEIHYPHLLAMETPHSGGEDGLREPSTPQDYLEKIFQIPFYLRPINDAGYRGLIAGLTTADVARPPVAEPPSPPPVAEEQSEVQMSSPVGTVQPPASVAAGRTAVASASKPAEPPDKLNPEQLKFREWELRDMQRLSPLFRTPRAVKRFVNTYRLVRVGIPGAQLAAFEGTVATPGRYRMAQLLLAIISGYPNAAPRFLHRLLEQSRSQPTAAASWKQFLKECVELASTPDRLTQTKRSRTRAAQQHQTDFYWREWVQLCETLQHLSEGDFVPDKLGDYYDLVPRVARFSFSVSILPE